MKDLKTLLETIEYEVMSAPEGTELSSVQVKTLVNDSRKLEAGCLFFAIQGLNSNGHAFVEEAYEKGACAVLVMEDVPLPKNSKTILIKTANTRVAMAHVSAAFFDYPARKLKTIGITGTKGKTTTTYMVRNMLENAGIPTGLIGTIEVIVGDAHIKAHNTTPESMLLQSYLNDMVNAGCKAVVMEVSSQALKFHRSDAITFDIGIFTNLEPDHIGTGEHEDFDDYLHCKSLLFQQCVTGIVNADDAHAEEILKHHTCEVETFAIETEADLTATDISLTRKTGELGIAFTLHDKHAQDALDGAWLKCPTPGRFSVYNALCAIAVARHFHCDVDQIKEALLKAHVKGRVEMVKTPFPFTMIIDYAHNAMSLQSLLLSLKEYRPARLITLFGCGGNRAKDRRYEMGEISGKLSDLTIITSDNPRDEEPMDIIKDIETGVKKTHGSYVTVPDRIEAIRYAMKIAEDGDVIVLAGKGHEDYQEIKGVRHPMDERVIVRDLAKELQES
ncbi:MAG: UDP-N-acetylmuramoyl-L-alanyl-D-glutamate--2,6-diaminopimelate ligase [Lachnospiraceae bacterium]|nr:UDP-N-acetylmuramoyl-L-alanyl-D-glutamate--2,6-diaminopimelate ligase [Lachnospiraceae bacterium]